MDTVLNRLLPELLKLTDDFAVENVRSGRGGPFGSSLHIYNRQSGVLQQIGSYAGNAVLLKGMGSAHAESEVLSPDNVRDLRNFLYQNQGQDLIVILSSSGESCVACHAKEEIVARSLIDDGLLADGAFIVNYGATYEQTRDIAGFNDLVYLEDFANGYSRGHIAFQDMQDVPVIMHRAIQDGTRVAVLTLSNGQTFVAADDRHDDLMGTAEVRVIQQACAWQKEQGADTPWDLEKAVLKTMCPPDQIGALTYAESLWANVGSIQTIWDDGWDLPYQDCVGVSNREFFEIIGKRPYNQLGSCVQVMNLADGFLNQAQYVWRDRLNQRGADAQKILYNGAEISNNTL